LDAASRWRPGGARRYSQRGSTASAHRPTRHPARSRRGGKHATSVFTFRGEPIKQINTKAWKDALKRAGITNFRWHDLRHTWASWHVQNGTPLYTLQEMGAWQTQAMVHRYAHLSSAHLALHAANLPVLTQPKETESDR